MWYFSKFPNEGVFCIHFKACLFNLTFHKGSHSKGLKQRALHVHQTKTKHFIAELFAYPIDSALTPIDTVHCV